MAERFNTIKQSRDTFTRQPARVLLIDFRPPFDADTAEYLHQALADFFSLVTNLHGPIRTPFFGLFALGSYAENLFPLQHVKGNFPRLYSALRELKLFSQEDINSSITDVVALGLQDAVNQFKRQSQSFRQMSTSSCQLEVVIITCKSAAFVTKHIEQFTRHLELDTLKKIQVAAVQNTDKLQMSAGSKSPSEREDSPTTSPEDKTVGCGLVDVVLLEKDVLSFQNFFKTWLTDCGTDQEHIRIALPSGLSLDDEAEEDEPNHLTLKCDLHERLLNPALLPQQDRFIINSDVFSKGGNTPKQANPSVRPVYDLVAVQLLKSEALCESVLFGMPFIVLPTLCWKLDWEELESNQQHFHALCTILKLRDLVLLVKSAEVVVPGTQRVSPCGHFVLLPSETGSLLLKSVAVSELMLPSNHQAPSENPSENAMQVVDSCLDQLEEATEYNPLLISSGLYKSLTSQVRKQGPSARTLKRRFQPPQGKQQLQQKNGGRQQLTKKSNSRSSMRPVIFTAPKDASPPHAHQQSSKTLQSCNSKRLRTTSAADRYCYSPSSFPEEL